MLHQSHQILQDGEVRDKDRIARRRIWQHVRHKFNPAGTVRLVTSEFYVSCARMARLIANDFAVSTSTRRQAAIPSRLFQTKTPFGAPGGTRTPDMRIRRPPLYPPELRTRPASIPGGPSVRPVLRPPILEVIRIHLGFDRARRGRQFQRVRDCVLGRECLRLGLRVEP